MPVNDGWIDLPTQPQGAGAWIDIPSEPQAMQAQATSAPNVGQNMLKATSGAIFGSDTAEATPLGPLVRMDAGDFYTDQQGNLKAISNQDFIAEGPEGNLFVFAKPPVEGALGKARAVSSAVVPGLVAGAPTRLPGAGAAMPASKGQQVLQAAEQQGIDVTLPTVSNSRITKSAAAAARETPIASGIVQRGFEREVGQVAAKADEVAEGFSTAQVPAKAGQSVRQGLEEFSASAGKDFNLRNVDDKALQSFVAQPARKTSFAKKAAGLYEMVARRMPEGASGSAVATAKVLEDIGTRFDSPALRKQFGNSFAATLLQTIKGPKTWRDLRQLRTEVRQLKARDLSEGERTIGNAEIKRIEAALTEDIYRLTEQVGGSEAVAALKRADSFYRAGSQRLDAARSLLKVKSDEGLYAKVLDLASNKRSADISLLNKVRRSLGDDAWNDVAAVAIRNLGKPTAGAADTAIDTAAGPFSVGSYVTNYAKLSPAGKSALFGATGRGDLRAALDDLATIAEGQKRTARFSVPTGGGLGVNRQIGAGLGITLAAGFFDAWTTVLLATVGVAGAAKLLTSPRFVRTMTRIARTPDTQRRAQEYARLRSLLSEDKEIGSKIATELVDRLENEGQGTAQERDQQD